ncbi:olfactory receptor 52N2-like [Periophthalmus magnuspinnatus]|uniref:olfactory receptor 52N2-like n=1 Tax=Periophthalmus magnuspinnatus TaxID=409849 RepID=UPI00145BC707|nr:olfactory receptor 52N2-like [Periophthalmus magnuspinnatus]
MNVTISLPLFSTFSSLERGLLVVTVAMYLLSVLLSLFLTAVISLDARLHRPMYVLLVNLSLCGVLGGSTLCPAVLRFLLWGRSQLSLVDCLVQIFFTNVYTGAVFCLLAVMAFDRYVSICLPLRYHSVMTPPRLRLLLLWLYCFLVAVAAVQAYLTSRVALCRFSIDKLMCDSLALSNLACRQTLVVSAFGLFCSLSVIMFPCLLVLLSYAQIFIVILKKPGVSRRKAFRTCTPHLITFANFSMASFFGVINRRLSDEVPKSVNIVVCLVVLVFPPLLHPIVYGIKTQEIQQSVKRTLHRHLQVTEK